MMFFHDDRIMRTFNNHIISFDIEFRRRKNKKRFQKFQITSEWNDKLKTLINKVIFIFLNKLSELLILPILVSLSLHLSFQMNCFSRFFSFTRQSNILNSLNVLLYISTFSLFFFKYFTNFHFLLLIFILVFLHPPSNFSSS